MNKPRKILLHEHSEDCQLAENQRLGMPVRYMWTGPEVGVPHIDILGRKHPNSRRWWMVFKCNWYPCPALLGIPMDDVEEALRINQYEEWDDEES